MMDELNSIIHNYFVVEIKLVAYEGEVQEDDKESVMYVPSTITQRRFRSNSQDEASKLLAHLGKEAEDFGKPKLLSTPAEA